MKRLQEINSKILDLLWPQEKSVTETNPNNELIELVNQARWDWEAARSFFDNVTDPDLVDHAIYNLEAAEKKYLFLLKKARDIDYRINLQENSTQFS